MRRANAYGEAFLQSRFILCLVGLSFGIAACGGGGNDVVLHGGPTPVPTATPLPTFGVAGLPAGPLSPNATYQLTATETVGGSPVTPGPLTLTLDNPSVGTVSGTTLTAGIVNAKGTLTIKDAAHNLSTTVSVSVGSTNPSTAGDTTSFVGTISQTIVRPFPAPVASQAPTQSTTDVSIATTTSTGASFGGLTGLTDFKSVERDTSRSPVVTTTITTDAFERTLASGATISVLTPGSTALDSNGNTFQTTFGAGNGILDILPEIGGSSFTNTAALVYTENDSDSTTIARTVNADGSYTESDVFPDGSNQTIAVNADLSASFGSLRGSGASIAVSAPTTAPSPPGAVITYTASLPPAPMSTSTPTVLFSRTFKDWYPTTTLATDTTTTAVAQPIPAACNVSGSVGTSATVLAETMTRLDPALGTYETRTTSSFLAPFVGLACIQISDKLDDYYDYSGQLSGIVALSTSPIQTTTTTETVGLKTATIAGAPVVASRSHVASSAVGLSARSGPSLAIVKTSFERVIQRAYAKRHAEMRATLLHAHSLQQVVR